MLSQSQVDHVNQSLDMLKAFPVIVICDACDSGNVITNPSCVSCGTPLGQIIENIINKHESKTKNKDYGYQHYFSPSEIASGSSYISFVGGELSASSTFDFHRNDTQSTFYGKIDTTPVYNKCANCWTLNNIREYKKCPACGVSTSIEEIKIEEKI